MASIYASPVPIHRSRTARPNAPYGHSMTSPAPSSSKPICHHPIGPKLFPLPLT
jgi:hypothetical protein